MVIVGGFGRGDRLRFRVDLAMGLGFPGDSAITGLAADFFKQRLSCFCKASRFLSANSNRLTVRLTVLRATFQDFFALLYRNLAARAIRSSASAIRRVFATFKAATRTASWAAVVSGVFFMGNQLCPEFGLSASA